MIDFVNFTNCKRSPRDLSYAGRAGEKRGIIYKGEHWILKFPKNTKEMDRVNISIQHLLYQNTLEVKFTKS